MKATITIIVIIVLVVLGYMYWAPSDEMASPDVQSTEGGADTTATGEISLADIQQSFQTAPPEMQACLEAELGSEMYGEILAGTLVPSEDTGVLIAAAAQTCVDQLVPEGFEVQFQAQ